MLRKIMVFLVGVVAFATLFVGIFIAHHQLFLAIPFFFIWYALYKKW
jgi:hypothetical protein